MHRVTEGGPTWRSGRVVAGDEAVALDGVPLGETELGRTEELLDGPDGSSAALYVKACSERPGVVRGQTLVVQLIRWRRPLIAPPQRPKP